MHSDTQCSITSRRSKYIALLRSVGLRPTMQRLAAAEFLFSGKGPTHITAGELCIRLRDMVDSFSLATAYHTLRSFVEKGLLKEVIIDANCTVFDCNMTPHNHLVIDGGKEIIDVPLIDSAISLPIELPDDVEVRSVEVFIRAVRRPCQGGRRQASELRPIRDETV